MRRFNDIAYKCWPLEAKSPGEQLNDGWRTASLSGADHGNDTIVIVAVVVGDRATRSVDFPINSTLSRPLVTNYYLGRYAPVVGPDRICPFHSSLKELDSAVLGD